MHQIIAKLIASTTSKLRAGQTAQIGLLVRSLKKHVKIPDRVRIVVFGSDNEIMTVHLVMGDQEDLVVIAAENFERGSRNAIENMLRKAGSILDVEGEGVRFFGGQL